MSAPEIDTNTLVGVFVKIRDRIAANKLEHDRQEYELRKKLRRVENELLRRSYEEKVEGYKTPHGTTYRREEKHVSIADLDDFGKLIRETGDLLFYEQRPSLKRVLEYQKAHDGDLPPGVRMFREYRLRVRANRNEEDDDDD